MLEKTPYYRLPLTTKITFESALWRVHDDYTKLLKTKKLDGMSIVQSETLKTRYDHLKRSWDNIAFHGQEAYFQTVMSMIALQQIAFEYRLNRKKGDEAKRRRGRALH